MLPPQKPDPRAMLCVFTLAQLSLFFEWQDALTIVKPDTLIRWRRKGFRLFWKWKSRSSGRPRVPVAVRKLIVAMAENNPTWGEERIASELLAFTTSTDSRARGSRRENHFLQ